MPSAGIGQQMQQMQQMGPPMQPMAVPPQQQSSGMGALGIVLIIGGIFLLLMLVGGAAAAFFLVRASAPDPAPYSSPAITAPATTTAPTVATPTGPYTDKVGRYSIDFPGEPKTESSTDDTELGKVTLHEAKYEVSKNLAYAVNWTDFPIAGRPFSTDGALDGAVNGAAKGEGGTVIYNTKIKLGTVPGRDFMVKVSDPTTPFRIVSRVYQDGARQYQVLVLVSESEYTTNKTDIDDFLKSFKIL
jgi:hypothetical protein